MMSSDVRPSSVVPNRDFIAPISRTAAQTASTGWIDAGLGAWVFWKIQVGASPGTVTATWQQALTSSGGSAKALSGGNFASTAYTTSANNDVEERPDQLDVANGFRFIQLTLTVTVSTTLVAAEVMTGCPKNEQGPSIST